MSVAFTSSNRHRGRFLGLAAFGIMLLLATIALPLVSGASTYHSGLSVEIGSTDRMEGNVYIIAPELRFNATAPANVSIVTMNGDIRGRINGNLHLLAGHTNVHAVVGGSVYAAAGNVRIHDRVDGDVIVTGGDVTITSGATIDGDLIIAAGTASVDGTIRGSVYGTALTISQEGTVEDNVEVQASRLVVGKNARINGDLRYQSPIDARMSSSARVTGAIDRTNAAPWSGVGAGALSPFGSLLKLTWSLLTGAALIVLMPRLASRIADHGSLILQPAAVGLIAMILLPLAGVFLLGTIIGIPLGVILLTLIPIGLYLSQICAGVSLGRIILPGSWQDGTRGSLLLAMTLGVILIGVIRMAPVPFLGPIVTVLVTFWGFGALVMVVTDLTSRRLRASRV